MSQLTSKPSPRQGVLTDARGWNTEPDPGADRGVATLRAADDAQDG
jgi:hypothetical protein